MVSWLWYEWLKFSSNFFFFLDLPGSPGTPVADDVTNSSVALSWTPPEIDGGSKVHKYVVERRPKPKGDEDPEWDEVMEIPGKINLANNSWPSAAWKWKH